ncbi:hypothetical protein HPB48_019168 [Haemaphysalis longicornis]|uniref:RRM domain-containing protein n=1 Tax=Haemaphysalis longicornis TaxID=44386 RepID=A0A9J6GBP4_HAELO|nr:hypothetical protein HPB48_019168 [Haemaphysalis longicornis]
MNYLMKHSKDPKDTPPPTRVETREERVERKNYDTSESKLRREFEVFGAIKKIVIVHNKITGKPRGYAFVEYEHERGHALDRDGRDREDRMVRGGGADRGERERRRSRSRDRERRHRTSKDDRRERRRDKPDRERPERDRPDRERPDRERPDRPDRPDRERATERTAETVLTGETETVPRTGTGDAPVEREKRRRSRSRERKRRRSRSRSREHKRRRDRNGERGPEIKQEDQDGGFSENRSEGRSGGGEGNYDSGNAEDYGGPGGGGDGGYNSESQSSFTKSERAEEYA